MSDAEQKRCPGCGQPHGEHPDFDDADMRIMGVLAGWIGHSSQPMFHPEKGAAVLVPVTHPIFQLISYAAQLAKPGEDAVPSDFDFATLAEGVEPPLAPASYTHDEAIVLVTDMVDAARELVDEGQQFLDLLLAKPEEGGRA